MEQKYTASDCLVLRKCLENNTYGWSSIHDALYQFDENIIDHLTRSFQETHNVGPIVKIKLENWIKESFGYPINKKILNFVFEVPLENVPLYMNDDLVEPFVRWRCSIGK